MTKNPQRTPSGSPRYLLSQSGGIRGLIVECFATGTRAGAGRKNSRKEPHRPQPGPSARCAVNTTTHGSGVQFGHPPRPVRLSRRGTNLDLRSCGKRSSLPGRVARQRDRFLATAIELRLPPALALFSASGHRGFASPFIRLRPACIEWLPITTAVQPDRCCHQPLYRCSSRP